MLHTIDCDSGIYDIHFLGGEEKDYFAAVSSTGVVSFYYVNEKVFASHPYAKEDDVHEIKIHPLFKAQVFSQTTIITFFQFIPAQAPHLGSLISATTDDGGIYLMKYCLNNFTVDLLNNGEPINKHQLRYANTPDNAWCCAVSASDPLTIYSGGDGGYLIQDIVSFGHSKPYSYSMEKKRSHTHMFHDAGVTAILPLTPSSLTDEELLLTGSYDEHVRLYSTKDKKVLADLSLDGGVYRLKSLGQVNWFRPQSTTYAILACCMHAGTKIIHVKGSKIGRWSIEVVGSLNVPGNDPNNYCYAAAARLSGPLGITTKYEEKRLCVSGTWIDKKLVVWEFKHEFKRPEDQVIEGSHSTGIHVTPQEVSTGLQIPMGSGKPVSN